MKSRILTVALISMIVFTSCSKGNSIGDLETKIVEQKISTSDIANDSSFSVDISLKNKNGKDFVIEKGGELRLNSINVIKKKPSKTTSSSDFEADENPVFEFKNEEGEYVEISKEGLLIKTKSANDSDYKLDIKLKSGTLKEGSILDFSFSVRKTLDSKVIVLNKKVVMEVPVPLIVVETADSSTSSVKVISTGSNLNKENGSKDIKVDQ